MAAPIATLGLPQHGPDGLWDAFWSVVETAGAAQADALE